MAGSRPGVCGYDGDDEIDAGTSALMCTSTPGVLAVPAAASPSAIEGVADTPLSGGIPYAIGQASVVRIPIPGTNGLGIELKPRGWTPKGGSTSTLFFQDATGKRHLRRKLVFDYESYGARRAIANPYLHFILGADSKATTEFALKADARRPLTDLCVNKCSQQQRKVIGQCCPAQRRPSP